MLFWPMLKKYLSFFICNIFYKHLGWGANVKSTSFNRGRLDWYEVIHFYIKKFQKYIFADLYSWPSRPFWRFASHWPWLISSTFLLHVSSSSRSWISLQLWLLSVIMQKIDTIFIPFALQVWMLSEKNMDSCELSKDLFIRVSSHRCRWNLS